MREKQGYMGFSLIELMIVVSIIGIIATVAVPSFNQYLYRARVADAYQSISAIQKAETQHYLSYGRFTQARANRRLISGDGKIQTVNPSTGGYAGSWTRLGEPLPINSVGYFGYIVYTGFTDSAGDSFTTIWNGSPLELLSYPYGGTSVTINFNFYEPDDTCSFILRDSDFEVNQNPGEDWFVVFAVANLIEEPAQACTTYFQLTKRAEGSFSLSPVVSLDVGQ